MTSEERLPLIGPDRFGTLLTLILALFVLVPLLQEKSAAAVLIGLLIGLVMVAALAAVGVSRRGLAIGAGLVAVGVTVTVGTTATVDGRAPAWLTAVFAAVLAGTTVLVLRRILHHRTVTLRTVAGALCAYLLVGLAFGAFYRTLSVLDAEAFTEELLSASTYFSFVTLTTLGFGDIAPVSDVARSMVTLEAVIGQVLLVVLVARFVSTLGQTIERPHRGEDGLLHRPSDDD